MFAGDPAIRNFFFNARRHQVFMKVRVCERPTRVEREFYVPDVHAGRDAGRHPEPNPRRHRFAPASFRDPRRGTDQFEVETSPAPDLRRLVGGRQPHV